MNIYISLRQTESGEFSFKVYLDEDRTKRIDYASVTLPNAFSAIIYFNGLLAAVEGNGNVLNIDDESTIPVLNMLKDVFDIIKLSPIYV